MSYALTARLNDAIQSETLTPNLVICFEKLGRCYGATITGKTPNFDEGLFFDDPTLFFDGIIPDGSINDYISLSGTSDTITQQIEIDKGNVSSTQTVTVRLLDRGQEITQLISPGFVTDEILYTDATIYLGLANVAFPDDYITIVQGKVMDIKAGPGYVDFVVTHPEDLKKSEVFVQATSNLVDPANFESVTIQDLFYQKRSDAAGSVNITYTSGATGDTAIISTTGNAITVQIDTLLTKARTIKKKIENDENANQLVTVSIVGNGTNIQTTQATTVLSSSSEIKVESVENFLVSNTLQFRTFLRINDEIIEYTGINTSTNSFTGCVRQSLDSFGASHKADDEVTSFYLLGDSDSDNSNSIDLSLKLHLSGGPEFYTEQTADTFVNISSEIIDSSAFFVPELRLKTDYNVQSLDFVVITGSIVPGNNLSTTVSEVEEVDGGSVIYTNATFLPSVGDAAIIKFKSKYRVYPDGFGFNPNQLDIDQFVTLKAQYPSFLCTHSIYLKDTIKSKDLVSEIYVPSALYNLPRKGRVSIGITAPPIFKSDTPVIDLTSTEKPSKIVPIRSVNKNFYNSVVYRFNEDSVTDQFLNSEVTFSAESTNRINAPNKIFTIKAKGLRPSVENFDVIKRNAVRILDRYKFAAEQLQIEIPLKKGFAVEIGDPIVFGGEDLQISDITTGNRAFVPRIFEVINKSFNWKTGAISLNLLDTSYSTSYRSGVFSPSSMIDSGSTTSSIIIKDSFGTEAPKKEKDKWVSYVGKSIRIHNEDYTFNQVTTLSEIDPRNDYKLNINPPLTSAPLAGYTIDIVNYNEATGQSGFYKNLHVFFDPQAAIVSGISQTEFTVSSLDASKFYVGSIIRIHSSDYSVDSGETVIKVTEIKGVNIKVDTAIGFVPALGQLVDLIGFTSDKGKPYVWL